MNTRTNKYGGHECDECGAAIDLTAHADKVTPHECDPSKVLSENIRKVIARGIALRLGAEVITAHALEEVGAWMSANDYALITPTLEIVEVF